MNINTNKKIKIEYTIISRGTEKYGSKGYMGITEPINKKRYFVLANHYEKYVKSFKDSFFFDDEYDIENIVLSRFELIPKLAFDGELDFIKERILVCGLGSVGTAALIYLLDLGYKEIDILIKNNKTKTIYLINYLNKKYKANIKARNILSDQYDTYIDATGSSNAIESIFEDIPNNATVFFLGTPRESKYLIDPLDIHRKNLRIFGGHELNGHSWDERNKVFLKLLMQNKNKNLKSFVNIYNSNSDILTKVYNKKRNFFEVIKYDIQN